MAIRLLGRRTRKLLHQTQDFTELLKGYEPPSFPSIVGQALNQLADPTTDMSEVAAVVERDPGASTRVLRLANSAVFSPRSPITSVHQAAVLMGRNQLEALLISVGARGILPSPDCVAFEEQRFWMTAAKRAVIAAKIAERTDPSRRSENFTAALLQDMAVPVLAHKADMYGDLLEHWHNSDEDDLAALETSSFGWHHGLVAAWMGSTWRFPPELVSFIEGHHNDEESVDNLIPARLVSSIRETSNDGDEEAIEFGARHTDLQKDDLRSMIEGATEEASSLARLIA